jgi:polysaccharide chain length determinant protein (PEP-CTERM system associated)
MAAEYELTFSDYLSILKRRWELALITFILILLATIALALLLPVTYQSTGIILVESPRIPSVLVQETVTSKAGERIEVIRQRVMTRDNLFRIIKKFNLYPDDVESSTTSDLIDDMRESILVELIESVNKDQDEDKIAISFRVGFEYAKPEITHKVANELVTLFLDENVKARNERAVETTEFLTQELNRLKTELEAVENKVAAYKQVHSNTLPEHLDMRMGMIERADADIKEVDRDTKAAQEELRYLDVELTSAQSATKNAVGAISELDKAKAELERVMVLYKETHPTIRALKRKVETLEKSLVTTGEAKPPKNDIATDLVISKIQSQIEAAKARLNSLADQKRSLQLKISQLQGQVMQSPQVERGLFTLMRDYENAKAKYEEVKSKQVNAKIAENLESENKAERFSLLEPPIFPDKPSKPDRKKIMALGIIAALGGAIVLAMLFESLDKRVRGVESLTSLINMRPLVIIPYISTQGELKRKKNSLKYILSTTITLLILLLFGIHFLVMPLDLLIVKLMAKFA